MREKVDVATFASGDVIDRMLREAEVLYAARFGSFISTHNDGGKMYSNGRYFDF